VAQCHGTDTSLAALCRTMAGMASQGELAEQRQGVSEARRGFVFDPSAYKCQSIKCPCRGVGMGGDKPVRSSSEAGPHPRGRPALQRGGTSPEEAIGPRARGNLTRGGDRPSSEAEPHPRGRPALEQGGGSLVQCCAPRAKRSSARGWLGRLSGGPLGPPEPWAHPLGHKLS
jgi:hypothetical protein